MVPLGNPGSVDEEDQLGEKVSLVFVVFLDCLVLVVRKVIVVIMELRHQTGNNALGVLETAKTLDLFE